MSASESMKSIGKKMPVSLLDDGFISVAVKRSPSRRHVEKRGLIWFTIPGCNLLQMAKSMQRLKNVTPSQEQ